MNEGDPVLSKTDFYDLFLNGGLWFSWNKIFRRDIFEKYHIRYNNKLVKDGSFADQDVILVADYCKHCDEYYYISQPLYYYYKNIESISRNYRYNLLYANLAGFEARFPLVPADKKQDFCNRHLHLFLSMFENIFDKKNKEMSIINKFKYNQAALTSNAFQICLKHVSESTVSTSLMKVLKMHNYYLYWIYQKLSSIKNQITFK